MPDPAPLPITRLAAVFGRIGLLSFGGPAAQIALMHRTLVEERGWLTEKQFLDGLSFCMLLPGPEAMQLCTYAGWRLRGTLGGLVAGLLFVLPGALVVLAAAAAYARFGDLPAAEALFLGIKAAVVAIVAQALWRLSRRALDRPAAWVIAGLAFAAIALAGLPFPVIVAGAALLGSLMLRAPATPAPPAEPVRPRTLRTVTIWLAIWLLPLAALAASGADRLAEIGAFFAMLAVVTFGGAYAVLAYMAQAAVEGHGWLTAAQMIDALGLAETTPGPLILVTEFVGYLAGHGAGGWRMGLAAALVTLWATFAPCFLWIFAGAPYLARVTGEPRLRAALAGITAAVVGVILNLSLWFAATVLFGPMQARALGPLSVTLPDPTGFDPAAALLVVLAFGLVFRARLGIPAVLGLTAAAGLALAAWVPAIA